MAQVRLNRLTGALRDVCGEHLLREKWVLAPSRRVGQQWLEAVALSGQPVTNAQVESCETFALLRLAAPEMSCRGLTFLQGIGLEVVVARLFSRLREAGQGYLSELEPSPGLTRTLVRALSDLRLAGLRAEALRADLFEVQNKGVEIRVLLAEYERELNQSQRVDYAGVLRLAVARLRRGGALREDVLILLPKDRAGTLSGLERELWEAVPREQKVVLPVDQPGEAMCEGEPTDASLLRHLLDPAQAPPPPGDGTATIFRAIGEVNEVREVFQRCGERGLARDEVELLYTDSATYLPLCYEFACRLMEEGADALPVTFAEGVPARYTRPGRALLGWISWVQEGFPQSTLVRMIQDGLLAIDAPDGLSFARLGAVLRALPIGAGRERTRSVVASELLTAEQKLDRPSYLEDEDESAEAVERRRLRGAALTLLRDLSEDLCQLVPADTDQGAILASARGFLQRFARTASELDGYARQELLSTIEELSDCVVDGDVEGLDSWQWLRDLPQEIRVDAQGPRPGRLFVAPVSGGGHSGRPHTFVIGLDDARFPAAGGPDPLLLDGERHRLSRELPTAASRQAREQEEFAALLARLRGSVTLSYCGRSLSDDRDLFPSAPVWAAYRLLSGNHDGDQKDLAAWLPDPPASFAPARAEGCVSLGEWWLWRLCGDCTVEDPEAALALAFPHLGRGFEARRKRESAAFTEYDGYVPEAGRDLDPTCPTGHVLSSSRLETLGACPLEYFLRYAIEIEPPQEYEIDPTRWLDGAARGRLLHVVFRDFMSQLYEGNHQPDHAQHAALLHRLLERAIASARAAQPPYNEDVYQRERRELQRIADIFLREEEQFCQNSHPICFEAAIGLPGDGWRTPLDTRTPMKVKLPDGTVIRARGRIDRVDEMPGSGGRRFTIWDYKTGSARRYDRRDPFQQGRHLQNALYFALAEARLREVYPGAVVASFGYFFPSLREHGERLHWVGEQLAPGAEIIARLCALLRAGCFPFTDEPEDVRYSDYRAAYGDPETVAQSARRKLANPANAALEPFRAVRGRGNGI